MPTAMTTLAATWNTKYPQFTCTRNLPQCQANKGQVDNCKAKCEEVSEGAGPRG